MKKKYLKKGRFVPLRPSVERTNHTEKTSISFVYEITFPFCIGLSSYREKNKQRAKANPRLVPV